MSTEHLCPPETCWSRAFRNARQQNRPLRGAAGCNPSAGLSAEDDIQAGEQQIDFRPRDPTHTIFKQHPVQRNDL